ncbi:MAG: hypothetical protein QXQ57_06500 [Sulfolobales archaeon]
MVNSFGGITWVKSYPIDSLQIYFAGSLEIQEELINHGFYVPKSRDGRIIMPIPLIYSNFRGWLKQAEPITIERLIPPEWLGLTASDLGWVETSRGGKEAYELPEEEVYVDIGVSGDALIFNLMIKGYHLERISIRGVNPEKWTNWMMLYIDLEYIDELINLLKKHLPRDIQLSFGPPVLGGIDRPRRETQQGGKEVTYYVDVPVKDFSLCMGCFELVRRYLYVKASEYCSIDSSSNICRNLDMVISRLRLRLKHAPSINAFAKVGIAKISGKHPQIMIKLASKGPLKAIRGILKERVEGKARGELIYCDHKIQKQYIALDLVRFYRALLSTKNYVDKLPSE